MIEQATKRDSGFSYFIGYVLFIFLTLLTLAHVVAAFAGEYPLLGSPIILYTIAIFLTSHLHLNAYEPLDKGTSFKIIALLPLVAIVIMFTRSRMLITEEMPLGTHLFHFAVSWISCAIVTAVMLFGVYKGLHAVQIMRSNKAS